MTATSPAPSTSCAAPAVRPGDRRTPGRQLLRPAARAPPPAAVVDTWKRLVLRGDPSFEGDEAGLGKQSDLLQRPPGPLEGPQRLGLAATAVQCEHEQLPAALTQQLIRDERLEHGDVLVVVPHASSASASSSSTQRFSSSSRAPRSARRPVVDLGERGPRDSRHAAVDSTPAAPGVAAAERRRPSATSCSKRWLDGAAPAQRVAERPSGSWPGRAPCASGARSSGRRSSPTAAACRPRRPRRGVPG